MTIYISKKRKYHKKQTDKMWWKFRTGRDGKYARERWEKRRIWEGFLEELKETYYAFYSLSWVRQTSAEGQVVHILGFVGHVVSVATIQLFCCKAKAAIDSKHVSMSAFQWKFIYKNRCWVRCSPQVVLVDSCFKPCCRHPLKVSIIMKGFIEVMLWLGFGE